MLNKQISNWNVWDLHFHTKTTNYDKVNSKNLNNNDFAKEIIRVLTKEQVNLVVLTDHMTFNQKLYTELVNETDDNLTIIPGIEINIKIDKVEKYVQVLAAFNPEKIFNLIKLSDFLSNNDDYIDLDDFVNFIYSSDTIVYWEFGKSRGFDQMIKDENGKYNKYEKKIFDDLINNGFISNFNMTASPENPSKVKNFLESYFHDSFNNSSIREKSIFFTASDCHDIDFYPCKDENQSLQNKGWKKTWFKSINSYNGLKLAFSEKSRIFIEQNQISQDPFLNNNINFIESVEFKINGISSKIEFSKYFNSIIGERSSGKSLLFKMLTNNIDENKNYKQSLKKTDIKINWFFKKEGSIDYFEQNNFIAEGTENKEKLVKIIKEKSSNLVSENVKINLIETEKLFSNMLMIIENLMAIKNIVSLGLISDIWSYTNNNEVINDRTIHKNTNNFLKMYNIVDLIINENNKIIDIINSLKQQKINLENTKIELEKIESKISFLKKFYPLEFKNQFLQKFEEIHNAINLDILNYENLNSFYKELLSKFTQYFEVFKNQESSSKNSQQAIEIFNSKKEKLFKSWIDISSKIMDNKKMLKFIDQSYDENKNYIEERNILRMNLNDKEVEIIMLNRKETKNNFIFEYFNNILKNNSNFKGKADLDKLFNLNTLEDIDQRKKMELKVNDLKLIKSEDILIKINNRELSIESPGERAAVLLDALIDENSTNVLVIDQPEDNLDNSYISKYLKVKFKKIKENRQVICISHNSNIVINCDSENIIKCSNNQKNEITYDYGAIEFAENIHFLTMILEGGKDAIEERYKKINLFN